MNRTARWLGVILALVLGAGCSRPVIRDDAMPSRSKDQYLRLKRIAIFPFENYTDTKDADKTIDALLVTSVRETGTFELVEDTRFVRDTMKKLKITSTDILDKETIKKLGDEMNVQGIIYGKILGFGKGKDKDSASQLTMEMALLEPSTGTDLWIGNVTSYGGLTVGKIFGVTEGMTDIEVARIGVRRLASSMASEVRSLRDREAKGIVADLRKEQDLEKAKLEKMKGETGKIQEQLDKAKSDAQGIRDAASKDADKVKTELELQKAAVEAEKSKTSAAQEAIEKEKLQVELERKKIEEDLKKVEAERKKAEDERKKALEEMKRLEEERKKAGDLVKEEPVTEPAPAGAVPSPGVPSVPAVPAAPGAPAPAPAEPPPLPAPPPAESPAAVPPAVPAAPGSPAPAPVEPPPLPAPPPVESPAAAPPATGN